MKGAKSGTCPVKHDDDMTLSNPTSTSKMTSSNWWNRFSSSPSLSLSPPNINVLQRPRNRLGNRHVQYLTISKDIPASLEEAARYAQTPQPDQTIPLALDRQVSSIPRGSGTVNDETVKVPDHQLIHNDNDNDKKWVYPSEQQMYNAMRKKGWTNIPEESIPVVLKIHNHINESTWNQILEWENVNRSSSSPPQRTTRTISRKTQRYVTKGIYI